MKQETLEEAAIINCKSITYPYCDREKSMFIKGAKWQMDKQDELAIGFAEWCLESLLNGEDPKSDTTKELLKIYNETFKNK